MYTDSYKFKGFRQKFDRDQDSFLMIVEAADLL